MDRGFESRRKLCFLFSITYYESFSSETCSFCTLKRSISGQSTPMVKGGIDKYFIWQILPLSEERYRLVRHKSQIRPQLFWASLKSAAGGNGRPRKMAPTQVISSNRAVVANMFWMLRPTRGRPKKLRPILALVHNFFMNLPR